ncbi:hypothetical protein [Pseudonocardia acidicola]|uniref:DUF4190 domain-containing protein n=1 Tax=Pseudonocardia acidicola TaxID=2724939 RepID=A0ABX1SEE8_9PSEU|nr:hypothetical protein [Pseudonocardia acidicola]NMH99284.1 hypothetical protein [Pseudonocardia acidicola]
MSTPAPPARQSTRALKQITFHRPAPWAVAVAGRRREPIRRPLARGTAALSYVSLAGALASVLFFPIVLAPIAIVLGTLAVALDRSADRRGQWAGIDGIVVGVGVTIWALLVLSGML